MIIFLLFFLKINIEVKAKQEAKQIQIRDKLPNSTLPEKADMNILNDWLVSLRRKSIIKSLDDNPDGIYLSSYLFCFANITFREV